MRELRGSPTNAESFNGLLKRGHYGISTIFQEASGYVRYLDEYRSSAGNIGVRDRWAADGGPPRRGGKEADGKRPVMYRQASAPQAERGLAGKSYRRSRYLDTA